MSWYKKYTAYQQDVEDGQAVLAKVATMGITIGTPVRYKDKIYTVKQLWISGIKDPDVRVELDDPYYEDMMIDLRDVEYGAAIEALFGEKNVTT